MKEKVYKVYAYRWVVLAVFMFINAVLQMQWLVFAPIAKAAQSFYSVSSLGIDVFAMVYMGMLVVTFLPGVFIVNTYGIRIGVGIGAVLVGVFGLLKGIYGSNYTIVLISQFGLAAAQPFIICAITAVAARWFPLHERATATGLASLAVYLGILFVMVVTPHLLARHVVAGIETYNIKHILIIYAIISLISAIAVLIFMKEKPPTPPGVYGKDENLSDFINGLKKMFVLRDMVMLIILFFILLGIFNALSTCIDQLCKLRGLNFDQTGLVGGVMLLGGILGAVILPLLSDRYRKRKIFIVLASILIMPGIIGLTFTSTYIGLLISSTVFGLFCLGAGPIAFQYAAEITYPVAEATSNGLLLLIGQVSGILFVFGINWIGIFHSMILACLLMPLVLFLAVMLHESPMVTIDDTVPSTSGKEQKEKEGRTIT